MSSSHEKANHTELYQLCVKAKLPVLPNDSREAMGQLMTGELERDPPPSEIDGWRRGILGFAADHWKVLQNQTSCPLKNPDGSFNPQGCFGCLDTQVVSCVVDNANYIPQIERYK
jgi:hypothetical protein